jgi:hypothetical protein
MGIISRCSNILLIVVYYENERFILTYFAQSKLKKEILW